MKKGSNDLFSKANPAEAEEPLAARMRPRTIDEYVGQDHIMGPGRLLRRAIAADMLSSVIFYGPPGTGKTTLARVIANSTRSSFVSLNAVLSGVKEVRESIAKAQTDRELYGRRTILFVDEVHRWNKAQQDALLPWVENGTVILIGATTENPFFEVNSALVSRSRVFQLKALSDENLYAIARQALDDPVRGYGNFDVTIEDDALDHLVRVSDGDARSLLNALQLAVETTPDRFPPERGAAIHITLEIAEESIQRKVVLYDKEGDYHFDTISAFIKSLRGSDPDAALYWMARMIRAGEDPHFIFRRMLISAGEDVGLADPYAIVVVEAAAAAFDRVGMPEGQFHLTHAALYLATAPKSNSSLGYFDAARAVEEEARIEVPSHLRDASRDKEGFGHGEGYLYPHAYRDHWVAQAYLPDALVGKSFYRPSAVGYEGKIQAEVSRRKELQLSAMLEEPPAEVLTFTPESGRKKRWLDRISNVERLAAESRDTLFDAITILRHERVLVWDPSSGIFLFEAARRAPEGLVVGLVPDARSLEVVEHIAAGLEEIERPTAVSLAEFDSVDAAVSAALERAERAAAAGENGTKDGTGHSVRFEAVLARDPLTRPAMSSPSEVEERLSGLLSRAAKGATVAILQTIPRLGGRPSELVRLWKADAAPADDGLAARVRRAEDEVYGEPGSPLVGWSVETIERALSKLGCREVASRTIERNERRVLRPADIDRWFNRNEQAPGRPDRSTGSTRSYGESIASALSADELARYRELLDGVAGTEVAWRSVSALVTATVTGLEEP